MEKKDVFYIGFDNLFDIDFSDALDDSVNLVGAKVIFTLKDNNHKHGPDSDAAVIKDFTIASQDLDEDNPKLLKILVSAAQSTGPKFCEGVYFWDCKIFNSDNTGLIYLPRTEIYVQDDVGDRIAT